MKTTLHSTYSKQLVAAAFVFATLSVQGQTYTTKANGAWNSASTWQSGVVPPSGTIPSSATIRIKHIVNYTGTGITNNGTINVDNQHGVSARLLIPGNVNITNNPTGKINIVNGELRQYRFTSGGESGSTQNGIFKNSGGYVKVTNSFVEIAQDWSNEGSGKVVFRNSSLVIGRNYDIKNTAIDTVENTSLSLGLHGSGNYSADGAGVYFYSARIEVASLTGNFSIKKGTANGSIDYITLKNHVSNLVSTGNIDVKSGVSTSGLVLDAYCALTTLNYKPNGKISGSQSPNCGLKYFPAGLMGSTESASLNFSVTPTLVSGTALLVNATYKYESVTPGVDAIVKVDSLVNGAQLTIIDDNTGGLGYAEGFQPEIKDGPSAGRSYAVFTISYRITGTSTVHQMNSFSLTALDIDGNSALKEFDQIEMGTGAHASFLATLANISLAEVKPGAFRGSNIDGEEMGGIDTASLSNMFSVTNTYVSSFVLKLGTVKTNTVRTARQYGIYMKGFVYPSLAVLPVSLESFTATLNKTNDKANLVWNTVTEINLDHFAVERSFDGNNFSVIGTVNATGNSTEKNQYTFTDHNLGSAEGMVYYRLRSIDNDNKSVLSQVRVIRLAKEMNLVSIQAYPNPVANELRVTIPAAWQNKKVSYVVYGNNGQPMVRQESASAGQTELMNVSKLAPGFYVIKVACNNETSQQKIIKQ